MQTKWPNVPREPHKAASHRVANRPLRPKQKKRYTEPPPLNDDATPLEAMRQTLQMMAGRALYGLRKCTVEPVIGIIKLVMGFRYFSLRGFASVSGELSLVALAWNLTHL